MYQIPLTQVIFGALMFIGGLLAARVTPPPQFRSERARLYDWEAAGWDA